MDVGANLATQALLGGAREEFLASTGPTLELLGAFALWVDGEPVSLAKGSQRLLVFVALHRPPERRAVAGSPCPDSADERASANLRARTWRLPVHGRGI